MKARTCFCILAASLAVIPTAQAIDMFGTGENTFGIEFVTIGNAGNANDSGASGSYHSDAGGVAYEYRISKFELCEDAVNKANTLGSLSITSDSRGTNKPATDVSWNEAARFINWLNDDAGYIRAYKFEYQPGEPGYDSNADILLWSPGDSGYDPANRYRNSNAFYFLPSEDEWYKAAFHRNDGVTGNYWDYPTGSDSVPDGINFDGDTEFEAVFDDGYEQAEPNDIDDVGSAIGPYGTWGQGGNAWEWLESSYDGTNNASLKSRAGRGGYWLGPEAGLRSSVKGSGAPSDSNPYLGFRVASIPEPSSALLLLAGLGLMTGRGRRR